MPSVQTQLSVETMSEVNQPFEEQLIGYLLKHGVLDGTSILDSGMTLVPIRHQRSTTLFIEIGERGSWVVKAATPNARDWARREIACYECLQQVALEEPVAPTLIHADSIAGVIVMERVSPGNTLAIPVAEAARVSRDVLDELALTVARVHRCCKYANKNVVSSLSHRLPWIVKMCRDVAAADPNTDTSHGAVVYAHPKMDLFASCAGMAGSIWRTQTLIHGDLKWDNALLCSQAEREQAAGVLLIDWELGGWGDPDWDVACVVQELLLMQPVLSQSASTKVWTPHAQSCIAQFLMQYRKHVNLAAGSAQLGLAVEERYDWLQRVSLYTGIRLLQSACEYDAHESSAGTSVENALALASHICNAPYQFARDIERCMIALSH